MDSFSKIISIIIAVIVMFLSPLLYLAQKQDVISQSYLVNETAKFVDSIKNTGFISRIMYQDYIFKIGATNNRYHLEVIHTHKVVEPVYDQNTGEFLDDYDSFFINTYQEEILDSFDKGEDYYFSKGDSISVKVVNKSKTIATKLMELIYGKDLPDEQILVTYGGMIRDEVNESGNYLFSD